MIALVLGVVGVLIALAVLSVAGALAQLRTLLDMQTRRTNDLLTRIALGTELSVVVGDRNAKTSERMADVICRQDAAKSTGVVVMSPGSPRMQ